MAVSTLTYERLALEDPEGRWELYRGNLRGKPNMTMPHNSAIASLHAQLVRQVDDRIYQVRSNTGRVSRPEESYLIPDVMVVPIELLRGMAATPHELEQFAGPLPFVAEVWSASTGDYDVDTKIPEYRARGDAEIWRIQPYERTVTAWRRQEGVEYLTTIHAAGAVPLVALPGVIVDIGRMLESY